MEASGGVTERQETTDSGYGTPNVQDLRKAAADLLHDIADDRPVDLGRVRDLGRQVLASDIVEAARRAVEADDTFALRRGTDLAAAILALTQRVASDEGNGSTDP